MRMSGAVKSGELPQEGVGKTGQGSWQSAQGQMGGPKMGSPQGVGSGVGSHQGMMGSQQGMMGSQQGMMSGQMMGSGASGGMRKGEVNQVLVLGASGNVGSELVKFISENYSCKILAGMHDTERQHEKSQQVHKPNVQVLQANMKDCGSLKHAIPKGIEAVFINTPNTFDRDTVTCQTIDCCKEAGARHITLISMAAMEHGDHHTIFGRQFSKIESHLKGSGLPYTLLRCPLFLDNLKLNADSIKREGKLYGPCRPDARFTPISICDVAEAAGCIITSPSRHANKAYKLTTTPVCENDIARAFSSVLGKDIKYVQVPYDQFRNTLLSSGMEEWQADGLLELKRHIDEGAPYHQASPDFKAITGRDPKTMEQWVRCEAGCFK